jgi:hypothetical protein
MRCNVIRHRVVVTIVLSLILALGATASAGSLEAGTHLLVVLDPVSSSGDLSWFGEMMASLDATFDPPEPITEGKGGLPPPSMVKVKYGLLLPDYVGQKIDPVMPLGSFDEFDAALDAALAADYSTIPGSSGDIDGLHGIQQALTVYEPGVFTSIVIFVSDGGMADWGHGATTGSIEEVMMQQDIARLAWDSTLLNVIVNHGYHDGSNPAVGAYGGEAVQPDYSGQWSHTLTETWSHVPGPGEGYAHLALDTGGSSWDMAFSTFASESPEGSAFRQGFQHVKLQEIGGKTRKRIDPSEIIPEPGSLLLVAVGAGALWLVARRRRRR